MVAASIGSLNWMVIPVLDITSTAPSTGVTETTLGDVTSRVVKLNENADAIALPAWSFTPAATVAVYPVEPARAADGAKVPVLVARSYETVPVTGGPPAVAATVNEPAFRVAGSIASLNVTVIGAVTATPVAPATGDVDTTLGGASSRVVNEKAKSDCRLLPDTSFTPVVTVAEMVDALGSAAVGVN